MAQPKIPKYRHHKPSGLGVVRIGGRDHYLGKFGTPASQEAYRRVIAEWLSAVPVPMNVLGSTAQVDHRSVNEFVLAYLEFAEVYYRKNGRPTGESENIKFALRPLVEMYGSRPVREFGPVSLKAVRQRMIESSLSRGVINARVNRIRRLFRWGVENELVEPGILHGLLAVAPLKRGRCEVRDCPPVRPVSDDAVQAVLNVLPTPVAAMVRLQRLTGMRPGEVVRMRAQDIQRSGVAWSYIPSEHKTQHHERCRRVFLGPQAQGVLRPFMESGNEGFLFTPQDAMRERRVRQRLLRRSPLTPSQIKRGVCAKPLAVSVRYSTKAYARAIRYACDQVFKHPELSRRPVAELTPDEHAKLVDWKRSHRWVPNQLRHTAATALRREFGLDAARVVLGHGSSAVTEIYAEQDLSKAAAIMSRVG